jgi:hypothetical protein
MVMLRSLAENNVEFAAYGIVLDSLCERRLSVISA